jgi:hypothetical protein
VIQTVLVPLRLVPTVTVIVLNIANATPALQEIVKLQRIVTVTVGRVPVTVGVTVTALTIVTANVVQTPSATATVRRTGTATVRK